MSFFRKTEIVEVEKIVEVERIVLGEPHRAKLFHAYRPHSFRMFEQPEGYKDFGMYPTCKDAFDANPGCNVEEVEVIRIGGEYFTCGKLKAVKVKKPKRAARKTKATA